MKEYFPPLETNNVPHWMSIYIALMLVLLTMFVFLIRYTEQDPYKAKFFKENYKKAFLLAGKGKPGKKAIVDVAGGDPLTVLVNRMMADGISLQLVEEFLTINQIKDLQVKEGQSGVSVVIPDVISFAPGKLELSLPAQVTLERLAYLADQVPYLLQIDGYAASGRYPVGQDALEYSARTAMTVYQYMLDRKVSPLKLKVCGHGTAGKQPAQNADRVEITFKEPEL